MKEQYSSKRCAVKKAEFRMEDSHLEGGGIETIKPRKMFKPVRRKRILGWGGKGGGRRRGLWEENGKETQIKITQSRKDRHWKIDGFKGSR